MGKESIQYQCSNRNFKKIILKNNEINVAMNLYESLLLGMSKWIAGIGYPISEPEILGNWISDIRFFGFRERVRV